MGELEGKLKFKEGCLDLHKARGKERWVSSIRFSGSYSTGAQESPQEKPRNESAGQED